LGHIKDAFCKSVNLAKSYIVEVRWEWHKGGFYLFKKVPQHLKLIGRIGLFLIGLNIILTLITFFYGDLFYPIKIEGEGFIYQLPRISVWLSTFFYALGWGLILTGAVFTNIWVVIISSLFYVYYVLSIIGRRNLWSLMIPALIIFLIENHLALRKKKKKNPWPSFFISFGVTLLFLIIVNISSPTISSFASNLSLYLTAVMYLISIIWFILGVDVVELAELQASWITKFLKRIFAKKFIYLLVFLFWNSELIIYFFFRLRIPLIWEMTLRVNFYITLGFFVLTFVLWWLKKLNISNLLFLFSLSIISLLLIRGYYGEYFALGSGGTAAGLFLLILLFIGLIWNIIRSGARFVDGNSKSFPSAGRLFLYLGYIALGLSVTHFFVSAHKFSFFQALSLAYLNGILYLGIPYFLYKFLYQQEKYKILPAHIVVTLYIVGAFLFPIANLARSLLVSLYAQHTLLPSLSLVFIEEFLKFIPLCFVLYHTVHFKERLDGIIAASAIALSFVTVEIYGLDSIREILVPLVFIPASLIAQSTHLFSINEFHRVFGTAFIIPKLNNIEIAQAFFSNLTSATIIGYFLGIAKRYNDWLKKTRTMCLGLLLVFMLRGFYQITFHYFENYLIVTQVLWFYLSVLGLVAILLIYLSIVEDKRKISLKKIGVSIITILVIISITSGILWRRVRFSSYLNPKYNISIKYPLSWKKIPIKNPLQVISQEPEIEVETLFMILKNPPKAYSFAFPAIITMSTFLMPESMNLDELSSLTDKIALSSTSSYHQLGKERFLADGKEILKKKYSFNFKTPDGKQYSVYAEDINILIEGRVFSFNLLSDSYFYNKMLPYFNITVNSFKQTHSK